MNRSNNIFLIIIGFLIIIVVVGSVTLAAKRSENDATEISLSQVETPLIIGEISIDGAVSFPGIFHFTDEDTIQSILADAGAKPDASLSQIKIYIPYKDRSENGHFNCIEDILLIKGFGEVTFNDIKDLITISE